MICPPHEITRIVVQWPTAAELGYNPDVAFVPAGPTAQAQAAAGHHSTAVDGKLRGYMWHCHMLEHEDHDMMARFRLVPS